MFLNKKLLLINIFGSLLSSNAYATSLRKLEEVKVLGPEGCTYIKAEIEYERGHMPSGPGSIDSCVLSNGDMVDIKGMTNEIKSSSRRRGHGLISGETTLSITGATISDGVLTIPMGAKVDFKKAEIQDEMGIAGMMGMASTIDKAVVGTKKVFVIRADALDSSTSTNMAGLSDSVFGTDGDPVNLKSQYSECSYNQLNFEPVPDTYWNGVPITGGVGEVTLSSSVQGADNNAIREKMISAANTKYDLQTKINNGEVDHVLLCIPPGTSGSWIAYAYINHWLSVYNNNWCNYVSVLMHEVGHNLGLAHSGETATYDDQSCMMGYSYSSDDTPEMCFNAPKNWQLGWYPDGALQIASGDSFTGRLIGLADYSTLDASSEVMVKIKGYSVDYYISFNRQTGINKGTYEGGNQVLVHSRAGDGYTVSYLLAKLSAQESYTIEGETTITANSISLTNPGYAEVSIVGPNTEAPATAPPTDAPITPPTNAPTIEAPPTTPFPTQTAPTMYPTHVAPTLYPTHTPPTSYPTGSTCKVKGEACTKHKECCGKKCNLIKNLCRKQK